MHMNLCTNARYRESLDGTDSRCRGEAKCKIPLTFGTGVLMCLFWVCNLGYAKLFGV